MAYAFNKTGNWAATASGLDRAGDLGGTCRRVWLFEFWFTVSEASLPRGVSSFGSHLQPHASGLLTSASFFCLYFLTGLGFGFTVTFSLTLCTLLGRL